MKKMKIMRSSSCFCGCSGRWQMTAAHRWDRRAAQPTDDRRIAGHRTITREIGGQQSPTIGGVRSGEGGTADVLSRMNHPSPLREPSNHARRPTRRHAFSLKRDGTPRGAARRCVVHSMFPLRRIGHYPRAVHARGPRLNTHTRTIVSFSCVYSCIASRMSSPSITIAVTSFLLSSVSSSCVEGDRGKGSQRDHETSGTVVIFGNAWLHRPRL